MSSIVISGDTSGAITIAAPAVAGTNTLTLPAVTGTVLTTASPGTILQVVNANTASVFSSNSTTYVDITGLSVSITPKSSTSKILVTYYLNGLTTNSGTSAINTYILADGSSTLITGIFDSYVNGNTQTSYPFGSFSGNYLHSPATTSSITYKIRGKAANSNGLNVNNYQSNAYANSGITLMEIAA